MQFTVASGPTVTDWKFSILFGTGLDTSLMRLNSAGLLASAGMGFDAIKQLPTSQVAQCMVANGQITCSYFYGEQTATMTGTIVGTSASGTIKYDYAADVGQVFCSASGTRTWSVAKQ